MILLFWKTNCRFSGKALAYYMEAIRRTLKTRAGAAGEKTPELLVPHLPRFRELKEVLEQEEPALVDHSGDSENASLSV
jgi:hypothetical protein